MKFNKRIIVLLVIIQFVISIKNENESETNRKQNIRHRNNLMKNKMNLKNDNSGNTCNCEELKKEIERLKETNKQLMKNQGNIVQNNNQMNMNQNDNRNRNANNQNINQNSNNTENGELSTGSTQNTNKNDEINQNQQGDMLNNNNQINQQRNNANDNIYNQINQPQPNQQINSNSYQQLAINNNNPIHPPQSTLNNCNQLNSIYIPDISYDSTATTRIIESQRQSERLAKLKPLLKCFSPYNPYTTLTNTNSQCESCCRETLQANPQAVNCCIEKCIVDSNSQSKFSLFCINYKFQFNTVQLSIPEI